MGGVGATICHMVTGKHLDVAEIGRRLAARRERLGLDQEAVADRAGLSRPYISRLERGIVPNPKLLDLEQVASALELPLNDLVRPIDGRDGAREIRITECADILTELADEPPEVAETILRWLRESVQIARAGRLARTN